MTRVWYCAHCGYEVHSRGRCHLCRQRLVESSLPELAGGDEDDQVGYRLDRWTDSDRGRLIERLNHDEIQHRFEDDELVIAADDEEKVDDIVADVSGSPGSDDARGSITEPDGPFASADAPGDGSTTAAVRQLIDAARRLGKDPTDMNADADVAEASTAVFMAESYSGVDDESWAAVGRVTRRLLGALGAEEALEDEIRSQAAILAKLLAPVVGEGEVSMPAGDDEDSETVYELPDWLPEQRAELGILLDEAGIVYEWEGGDLIVPAEREGDVEQLFDRVGSTPDDDDDSGEARYHALEELFAAADRLASDPGDEQRESEAVRWTHEAAGPPPIGLDEVTWLQIMKRARELSDSIGAGRDVGVIGEEAAALRDLLRSVV